MSQPLPPIEEGPRDEVIERVERVIARLLRWGVLTSLVLMLSGLLIHFLQGGRFLSEPMQFDRDAAPQGVALKQIFQFNHGLGLIVLGLVILILTPLLRVVVSIIAYIIERDVAFVIITSIVLTLLIVSLFVGGHG
jgi:uncharacterized membrane protein